MWKKDLQVEMPEGIQPIIYSKEPSDLSVNRAVKQKNRLIFRSMLDHTKEKINWQALGDWQIGWDGCRDALQRLKTEIDVKQTKRLERSEEGGKFSESVSKPMKFVYSQAKDRIKHDTIEILW
jgi:hypothetical protein